MSDFSTLDEDLDFIRDYEEKLQSNSRKEIAKALGLPSESALKWMVESTRRRIDAARYSGFLPPRRIVWDIETSLMKFWAFRTGNQYLRHDMVDEDWYVLCISWRVVGEDKVYRAQIEPGSKDDSALLKEFTEFLRDGDLLIAHNGDQFDIKKVRARLMIHDMPDIPDVITYDTLKEMRGLAKHTSNSLAYLLPKFELQKKRETDIQLWKDCTNGDPDALAYMGEYCDHDVVATEQFYNRILKYAKKHPNMATFNGTNCPHCTSYRIVSAGVRRSKSGIGKKRYECQSCGIKFTGRKQVGKAIVVR